MKDWERTAFGILLGSTLEEAKRFKEEARGRMHDLQARIRAARRV